jgi:cell division initiation protein
MRLTVQEIRRHHFNRKVRGYDPVEVEAFLELVAQEMEIAVRDATDTRIRLQSIEAEVAEHRIRERTLQEALNHAQETAEQITSSAKRDADLQMKETLLDVEREKQKGLQELRAIQEETVKLRVQKESFLRRIRHILQAEQELLDLIDADTSDMTVESRELSATTVPGTHKRVKFEDGKEVS